MFPNATNAVAIQSGCNQSIVLDGGWNLAPLPVYVEIAGGASGLVVVDATYVEIPTGRLLPAVTLLSMSVVEALLDPLAGTLAMLME